MNEAPETKMPVPSRDDTVWVHDLRNAVNAVSIALHAADAMLQRDDRQRATQNILRAQDACARLLELVRPEASGSERCAHAEDDGAGGHRPR